MKVDFKLFKEALTNVLVFDSKRFDSKEEYNIFFNDAYIQYKTFCKEYAEETPEEWAAFFYEIIDFEECGFMLKEKYQEYYN